MENTLYSIESGETDPTQRYTMKLTKEEAKMSSHMVQLIQLSEQTPDHSGHFGSVDFMDAASMKKLEAYIKHYTHDEKPLIDKCTCYDQVVHVECIVGDYGLIPIDKSRRFNMTKYDENMMGPCEPKTHTNLARGAMYFGIPSLINLFQKYYALLIMTSCGHGDQSWHYFGAGRSGCILKPQRFFSLYYLFDIEKINQDEMNLWKNSFEYKNFISEILPEISLTETYQSLVDILSLTQRNDHSYMYYLGYYFPKIMLLLLPYLGSVVETTFDKCACNIAPNCDDMCLQLFCMNTQYGPKMDKIVLMNANITKIPPEIANCINLKEFDVYGCSITTLPKELASLKYAKKLYFVDCMIDSIPIELKPMVDEGILRIIRNPINYNKNTKNLTCSQIIFGEIDPIEYLS